MEFSTRRRVRFSDCDPAGIVFFPQYLVMINGQVEDWLHHDLGFAFRELLLRRRIGLPTVHLNVDFTAISHLDDELRISTQALRVGSRSITLRHRILGLEDDLRATVEQVLVTTSFETHAAVNLPAELRDAARKYLVAPAEQESASAR